MSNFIRAILVLLVTFVFSVQNASAATVSCTTAIDTQFVPSWGKVEANADQYSRYIIQYMYWDKIQRIQWLGTNGDSTFEPDALFYNYGDQGGLAYGVAPVGYWASDLPAPYVDTQFEDGLTVGYNQYGELNEAAVTIGSGWAVLINYGKVYYTVTRMTSGRGSSGWLKLSAQRGRQVPATCTSTWCSFGCDTNNNYHTIPFSDHFTAPSCQQYNWLWDTTVRRAC